MVLLAERIEMNPNVMVGKPVIRGTRIPVELLLRRLGEGATEEDLLSSYPHLTSEDILAAITYAADVIANEDIWVPDQNAPAAQAGTLRFLADESCDFAVIRALRGAGHDVSSIAEQARGTPDSEVIARAVAEDRVLITEDTDFGELVYANARAARGVMLLRFPERTRAGMAQAVLEFVSSGPGRVLETFVVIQPGRVRMTHLPNREAQSFAWNGLAVTVRDRAD